MYYNFFSAFACNVKSFVIAMIYFFLRFRVTKKTFQLPFFSLARQCFRKDCQKAIL